MDSEHSRSAAGPFLNMHFRVEIEGLGETGTLEVVFPQARIGQGSSGKSRARYGSMFLRRGLGRSQAWYSWWDEARRARKHTARCVTVTVLDQHGTSQQRWIMRGAKPLTYSLSNLNALGNETLIETLELSVSGFEGSAAP